MTTQTNPSFNWKIVGKAGDGVMVTAKLVAKIAKRQGLQAFNYLEYPSLIKGGRQTGQVLARVGEAANCQQRALDVLILFSLNKLDEYKEEITPKTLIVHNSNVTPFSPEIAKKYRQNLFSLPLLQLLRENQLNFLAANMLALGVSVYLLGLDLKLGLKTVKDEFGSKNEKLLADNLKAFQLGFEYFSTQIKPLFKLPINQDQSILVTGNEAVGLGALAAGLQFYSAYPMTPAGSLLNYLAGQQKNYPLVVKHAEDEIGAVNQALGAAYAGVRAMTGTSGGGFALMVEAISFASVAELPLVVLMGQRTGPGSGLPTWTAQADLSFILSAGHGDTQRIVLTPATTEEHFELTKLAFNLAEKYQLPVFILSDKFALEAHQTMPKPDLQQIVNQEEVPTNLGAAGSYWRYQLTKSGVSPRTFPGQTDGLQLTNSYEHDETGFATEEAEAVKNQVEKRARKLETLIETGELPEPYLIGPARAELTFISWGSTGLVMKEVVRQTQNNSQLPSVNVIQLPCVWPFPSQQFLNLLKAAKKLVVIEGNHTGQLRRLIAQETGLLIKDQLLRYDGRPFFVEDIIEQLSKENK